MGVLRSLVRFTKMLNACEGSLLYVLWEDLSFALSKDALISLYSAPATDSREQHLAIESILLLGKLGPEFVCLLIAQRWRLNMVHRPSVGTRLLYF